MKNILVKEQLAYFIERTVAAKLVAVVCILVSAEYLTDSLGGLTILKYLCT